MAITKYIWDADNCLAEADGGDSIQTVYTNEPQQYGNVVSSRIAGTSYYHHFDVLGSTRTVTNSTATTTDTMIYDVWGNVVIRTGTNPISLLWLGQLGYDFNQVTGLYDVRRRSYVPTAGRWTSVDPLGMLFAGYVYASNQATLRVDPSGLIPGLSVLPLTGSPALGVPIIATAMWSRKLIGSITLNKPDCPKKCNVQPNPGFCSFTSSLFVIENPVYPGVFSAEFRLEMKPGAYRPDKQFVDNPALFDNNPALPVEIKASKVCQSDFQRSDIGSHIDITMVDGHECTFFEKHFLKPPNPNAPGAPLEESDKVIEAPPGCGGILHDEHLHSTRPYGNPKKDIVNHIGIRYTTPLIKFIELAFSISVRCGCGQTNNPQGGPSFTDEAKETLSHTINYGTKPSE